MSLTPGTLLHPADLEVGQLVDALDDFGYWYAAKIKSVDGSGNRARVTAGFIGYGLSEDRNYAARDAGIRVRLPPPEIKAERAKRKRDLEESHDWGDTTGRRDDGTWEIEKIVGKRTRKCTTEYKVRWLGWAAAHDEWHSGLEPEIIEEYEEAIEIEAEERRHPPREPPRPFSIDECAHESKELSEQRIEDVSAYLEDIAATGGAFAARVTGPRSELKTYTAKPMISANFVALREHVRRIAMAADPERDGDLAVTPIESDKRGRWPKDLFSIMDDDTVDTIFGESVLTIFEQASSAVKIVAPLDVFLRGKRDANGQLLKAKELVLKAHYVKIVSDHEHPGLPIFRCATDFGYPMADREAYKRGMAKALLSAAQRGVVVSQEFQTWAAGH